MSAIPREIYPFTTNDGKAIPLDIVKPIGVTKYALLTDALTDVNTLEENTVVVLYSTVDCLISFTGTLAILPVVNGTTYTDSIFVPAGTLMTVEPIFGSGKAVALDAAGSLYVQQVEKWAGLSQPRSAIVR
jgi:hypothetical protein